LVPAALAFLPALALASEPNQSTDPRIYGGEPATTCAWPTTVSMTTGGSLCSGTLVHPSVVVYAAHCGATSQTRVRFGESSGNNPLTLTPLRCEAHPEYFAASDQDVDWAYCLLDGAVDIPVTPMLLGCEYDMLTPGTQVAIIGYGNNQTGGTGGFGAGTKRWAMASLIGVNLPDNVAQISELGEPSICSGDSGGPAMLQFPDGSWHTFGITSTGPATSDCEPNGARIFSVMAGAAPWVEERVGFDITPCHDPDGTWNPNAECQGFNASPAGAAYGTWSNGCVGGPVSGPSNVCGPSVGETPDTTPPTITLNEPQWGDEFAVGTDVLIDTTVTDADSAIKGIRIEINGEDIGVLDDDEPYSFPVAFGEAGQYEIVAIAWDWSGNSARSETALIGVGDAGPLPPDPTTGGSDDGTGDGWVPAMDGDEAGGCNCSTTDRGTQGGTGGWLLIGVLALVRRRRR
jgi:MYXO-CTERM domain-containing protein